MMHFGIFATVALSAGVMAAPEKRQASYDTASVLSVLETAIPSSVINGALTNSASVYSQVVSEFAAGSTPAWFTALPSDIQSLFEPVVTGASNVTSAAGTGATSIANATTVYGNSTIIPPLQTSNSTAGSNSTTRASTITSSTTLVSSTGSSVSTGASSSAGSSSGSTSSTSSSSGGASLPTAVYGIGLGAAFGLVGVLAL